MIARRNLSPADWLGLAAMPSPVLIGLWADTLDVHALFEGPLLVSTPVVDGAFPALSPLRPAAAPFERAVHDLWGHRAEGGDPRPWYHTADWPVLHPMSARPQTRAGRAEPEDPPTVPGTRHVLLSGPVRPGLREPALLRAVTDGRVMEAAEARLGWAHKGAALLMRSKSPRAAARFAARLQADSAVAHATAFAHAAEDASGVAPPARAIALRLLMADLETAAALLADAGPGAGPLLDALRTATAAAFGHRLMMDCVAPGGVLTDIRPEGPHALRPVLDALAAGPAAEAAKAASAHMGSLPSGPFSTALPPASGEGLGQASTPRGTVWHWVRLDNGTVANAFACDPACLAWQAWAAGLTARPLALDGIPHDLPRLHVSGADL